MTKPKDGDCVTFGKAEIVGVVIHAKSITSYVDFLFEPGKWIAHEVSNTYLEPVAEKDVPDVVVARRAARQLLGLDELVKK